MTRASAALVGVVVLTLVLVWLAPGAYRALPLLQPDSASYIEWQAIRPPAYPLTLAGVESISPTLALLGPLQLAVFLASAVWLGTTFARVAGHRWLGVALCASITLHPQVISYAFTALPESLLASALMAHVASTLRLLVRRSSAWALAAGLTLAMALLLKPAAMAFTPGILVVAVAMWHAPRRLTLVAAWVVAFGIPLLAASAWTLARVGVFSPQAIGGFALLGVTGTFMPDDTPVEPPALASTLLERIRPIRDDLERIEALDMYYFYSSTAYHPVAEHSRAAVMDFVQSAYPSASPQQQFVTLNAMGERIARVTIVHAPARYARHVAAHLYGLWLMPLVQSAATRAEFNARLAAVRQRARMVAAAPIMVRFVPAPAYWLLKAVLWGAVLMSVLLIVGWLVRPQSLMWSAGAFAAILLHSYFLATALAQTGLPRYALTAWPLTMLVVWAGGRALVPGRDERVAA